MKIAIGCDHGGIVLKQACIDALKEIGCAYEDFGTYNGDSVDYPDFAEKAALAVQSGECEKGILLCGTGIGIGIAANKFKGIRCAHVTDLFCAQTAAEHNNANIISMGGRITSPELAKQIVKKFFTTPFAGGRHERRIDKITAIEERNFK
jgi:ribose 5-phosphate isomerase B